jgi:outer membrane protein insertion porin family
MAISIATTSDTQDNSIVFVEPYLFGRDLKFGLSIGYSKTDDSSASYDTRSASISPSIEFPVSEQGRLALRYSLKNNKLFNVGTDDDGDDDTDEDEDDDGVYTGSSPILEREADLGSLYTSGVGYTYSYDTRINALDPNTNFRLSLGQDFNGLGGDIKSIVTKADLTAQTSAFQEEVTFTGQFQAGALHMLSDSTSRVIDRFSGSSSYVRGFESNGYGPRDNGADNEDALGGKYFVSAKLDAKFPIGLPEEYGVLGGLFFDVGSVWGLDDTDGDETVDDALHWRSAVGFSIYWTTPVGPLRLNFSKALLKEDYDLEQPFDLTVSTTF